MIADLPSRGSIWQRRQSGRALRVVLVSPQEIVGHNVEIPMRDGDPLESWASSPEMFFRNYVPHPTQPEEEVRELYTKLRMTPNPGGLQKVTI